MKDQTQNTQCAARGIIGGEGKCIRALGKALVECSDCLDEKGDDQ